MVDGVVEWEEIVHDLGRHIGTTDVGDGHSVSSGMDELLSLAIAVDEEGSGGGVPGEVGEEAASEGIVEGESVGKGGGEVGE